MQNIKIDFGKKLGSVKPMHAVNNGPIGKSVVGIDNFDEYAAVCFPYARNYDASLFECYGASHTVDVHSIFKNFDKDENAPTSYMFYMTDKCVKTAFYAGTEIFYRLGSIIEHGQKWGTYLPKDFAKWARICEHIIRRYTEGWLSDDWKATIEGEQGLWLSYCKKRRPRCRIVL